MKGSNFSYLVKQGIASVWHNRMMSFASFCIIMVSLLLVGLSLLIGADVGIVIGNIEDKNEIRQMYVSVGDDPNNNSGFIDHEIAQRFNEKWPSLSRDTGGKILELIYNSDEEVLLQNSEGFLNDNTFCEFGYVIDLDKNTLTCYCWGKNIFARYYLDNLPSNEKLVKDYEEYQKKNP